MKTLIPLLEKEYDYPNQIYTNYKRTAKKSQEFEIFGKEVNTFIN